MRVVLDTSVLVAASRSRRGAGFELIRRLGDDEFRPVLSVALYAEWQDALLRPEHRPAGISPAEAMAFLRFIAGKCHIQPIYFLWRPSLRDPDDDMILELAVAARCRFIVTHNVGDFSGSERFGVEPITPSNFLRLIRASL